MELGSSKGSRVHVVDTRETPLSCTVGSNLADIR